MNIFHTIAIKIAGVFAALIVFISGPTVQPEQVVSIASPEMAQEVASSFQEPVYSQAACDEYVNLCAPKASKVTVIDIPAPQAQPATAAPVAVPVYVIQPTAPVVSTPAPLPIAQPKVMENKASIKIVSPIGMKGLNREYAARETPLDEKNTLFIGAVVTNSEGEVVNDAVVKVTTSDESQDREINGTGDFWGNPHNVYYYPFTYEFRTKGDHKITFTAEGVSESVTISVPDADTR